MFKKLFLCVGLLFCAETGVADCWQVTTTSVFPIDLDRTYRGTGQITAVVGTAGGGYQLQTASGNRYWVDLSGYRASTVESILASKITSVRGKFRVVAVGAVSRLVLQVRFVEFEG